MKKIIYDPKISLNTHQFRANTSSLYNCVNVLVEFVKFQFE